MMIVPAYLPYYVLSGTVATVAAILFGLSSAIKGANWPVHAQRRTFTISTLILVGWCAAAIVLALVDAYRGGQTQLPTIQYGILAPILIGGLLIWRSASVARIIDAVPQQWLIGIQVFRVMGVIFLILYATGKLPGIFAWPAGLGDVLVGIAAPIVASRFASNPLQSRKLAILWNWLGISDLIVAVGSGFLTSPSPFQVFAFDLPNELIGSYPLVLIPVFLVPIAILLHITSLVKLRRNESLAGQAWGQPKASET
jgi:hypothetical protein